MLVVAGGGSGGFQNGGGGGAGGVIYRTNFGLSFGTTYSVVVGAGGVGISGRSVGSIGRDSAFGTLIAFGGGGGIGGGGFQPGLRNKFCF